MKYGGINMKKTRKTALIAAVLTGAVMLTGCDHGHDDVVRGADYRGSDNRACSYHI